MNPNLEDLMNQIPRSYLTAEERLRINIQRVILDGEERTLTTEELAEIEAEEEYEDNRWDDDVDYEEYDEYYD